MAEKLIVQANPRINEGRRNFLKATGLAALALFGGKAFNSMPLFAQDAKSIVKVTNTEINKEGNFSITGGSAFLVGDKILDEVTNKGDWKASETYLVNNDVYVLWFKFGVVMISDRSNAIGYKAYPGGIQKYDVLEPGKGEAVKVLVDGETITGRIVGPSNDKEIKLETKKIPDDGVGIMSGQATRLK